MGKKRTKPVATHQVGRWFAPSTGGYSGLGPDGEVVPRKGTPPKLPATPAGVAKTHAAEQRTRAS